MPNVADAGASLRDCSQISGGKSRQIQVRLRETALLATGTAAEAVADGAAPRFPVATSDGQGETVCAMTQMIVKGNAYEVVRRVKDKLLEIRPTLPQGVELKPFYDRAAFVAPVLHTVQKNLVEGGLIVALVLLWVLGSWRAGLLVASLIPLSMIGAFALMYYGRNTDSSWAA
jgi:cobalt-zinc-cadmium resistance protein CzcA